MYPDHTIGGYLRQYIGRFKEMLKNPVPIVVSIVLTILIAVAQTLLSVISAAGKGGNVSGILSLLLYANGGMYGGVLGVAGGMIGKMILLTFLNTFVLSLIMRQNPFASFGGGIKKGFGAFAFKRFYDPAAWLFGAGSALLVYCLCNFTQNRMNSLIGAYLAVMVIGSLGKKDSFLYGLLLHLFFGKYFADPRSMQTVTSLMGGSAAGYLAGSILSLTGLQTAFPAGVILLIPAILFYMIGLIVSYAKG